MNTSEITQWTLPRDFKCMSIPMGCAKHDGNKGQQMVDLRDLLEISFITYRRTGKVQTVTLPRPEPQ